MENALSPVSILGSIAGIGVLVCFIIVTVKMFQNNDTAGGVISIISALLCCIGLIININFVLGWTKASKWNMKNLMYVYTAFFGIYLLTNAIQIPTTIKQVQEQIQKSMDEAKQQQGGNVNPMPPIEAPQPAPAPGVEGEPAPANP